MYNRSSGMGVLLSSLGLTSELNDSSLFSSFMLIQQGYVTATKAVTSKNAQHSYQSQQWLRWSMTCGHAVGMKSNTREQCLQCLVCWLYLSRSCVLELATGEIPAAGKGVSAGQGTGPAKSCSQCLKAMTILSIDVGRK